MPEYWCTLARSCKSHPFPGHKVPNHIRQNQRQKEPQYPDQQRAVRRNHCPGRLQVLYGLLLPVFISHGENLHRASTRTAYPRSAPHLCCTLYDVGWEHTCPAENPGSSRH
nr:MULTISPECIES: hypothetical protein [Citrobacter]